MKPAFRTKDQKTILRVSWSRNLFLLLLLQSVMAIPAMAQQFRLIVKNGDELPGAPGDPVEYVYSERSFIDGGGNVVFGAELESGREGYWTQIGGETRLVAFLGEPAPGIAPLALSASSSSRPNLFFNANGELSMYTPTLSDGDSDGNNNRAILYFGEDGLEIVVRSGVETITVVDSRAGPVEWTMGSFDAFGSNGKEAVIRAGLRKPDNVSIFDLSSNNPGSGGSVWHVDPLGAEAVTYNPKELPLSPGWEMDSSGLKVAMNDVGDYVFLANGSGPDLNGDLQPDRYSKGIYRSRGGKMEVVLRESRTVASSLKLDVDELVMNNHGRIAFHGVMPPNNDSAIWVENADGRSFRRVAKVGDIALQGGGVAFSEFHGFHLSDEGLLTVWAVTSDGRDGVWMESKQGITYALWKVVMEGDDAPDDNGTPAVFSKLWQAIPNNSGQLLFSASREEKGDGSYIGRSFWIGSFHPIFDEPVFERVFGESDRVEVAQDLMPSVSYHTDISFSLDPFQNNSHLIGSGTPFNDDGQVLVGFSGNQFSPVYTQVRSLGW